LRTKQAIEWKLYYTGCPSRNCLVRQGGLKNVLWTEVWCVCTVIIPIPGVHTMKHTNKYTYAHQVWCIKRYGYMYTHMYMCSFYLCL
jgi:hypothetical protein